MLSSLLVPYYDPDDTGIKMGMGEGVLIFIEDLYFFHEWEFGGMKGCHGSELITMGSSQVRSLENLEAQHSLLQTLFGLDARIEYQNYL